MAPLVGQPVQKHFSVRKDPRKQNQVLRKRRQKRNCKREEAHYL